MAELVRAAPPAQLAGADFTQIHGVGRAVAGRLQAAGVYTYGQLAGLTPEELAGLVAGMVGLTAERIRQQDWPGQAAQLAAAGGDGPAAPGPRLHYASYTVELLLDKANHTRRTRVTHLQSGKEHSWAGWDAGRLADTIAQTAGLRPGAVELPAAPQPEAAPADLLVRPQEAAPQPEAVPAAPVPAVEATEAPTIALRLVRLEFVPHGAGDTGRLLRHDLPYGVALTLDLGPGAAAAPFVYEALVLAKGLGQPSRAIVVRAQGELPASGPATLEMAGTPLPPGMYRTEALVVLTQTGPAGTRARRSSAMLEGGLVQVY